MRASRLLPCLAVVALAASWAPPASAQTYHCPTDDSLLLVFRNPDLQPQPDGFIHAQGQFFVQFQAIGKDADKIKVFGFSFGPYTYDFNSQSCGVPQGAPWVTGVYIPNYRADRDPTDGFFIPVKTPLVPDGTYAAAVHAYDANNNELARFWAKAVVDNCDTQPTPAQEKCDTDPAQMQRHDKTAPWPIVLPGDGQGLPGHKFTIEFGEALRPGSPVVYLNGKNITAQMVAWEGRLWDADYEPDYGPGGASGLIAPPCSGAPGQTCEHYGPAYEWTGRDLNSTDVVRIEAIDLAGNKAVKDVHIGSSVAGGAVTGDQPILSDTVDHLSKTAAAGADAAFHFNITNSGGGTGHPFADAQMPDGWTGEWMPNHVPVPPGATLPQQLVVHIPANAAPGPHAVNATLTYSVSGKDIVLPHQLTVVVTGQVAAAVTQDSGAGKAAPMPLAFMAIGAAVLAARRRR